MYIPGLNLRLSAPYGLMILRVVTGIVVLVHGWAKWSGGIGNVAGFFGSLGIPAPLFFAYVVAIVETLGALLLIAGLLTQLASALIAIDMLFAILLAKLPSGIVERGGLTFELEIMILVAALCLFLSGPGIWSVDDVVTDTRQRA